MQVIEGSRLDLDLRVVHLEPDLIPNLSTLGNLVAGSPVVELKHTDFDALFEQCDRTSDQSDTLEDKTRELRAAATIAFRATLVDHDDKRATSYAVLACNMLMEEPSLDRGALCRHLDVAPGKQSRCLRKFHKHLDDDHLRRQSE